MIDRDFPAGPMADYVSPPETGSLPEDFRVKPTILRCPITDDIFHGLERETDTDVKQIVLAEIPKVLETTIVNGQWRDAYELQRLAAEYGQSIDIPLQKALGKAVIEWGAAGLEALFTKREVNRPEGVRGNDIRIFCGFINRHVEQYDAAEETWFKKAKDRINRTIISYIIDDPHHAEYELVDSYDDPEFPKPKNLPDSFLYSVASKHPESESLQEIFLAKSREQVASRPRTALQLLAMGYRSGILAPEQVKEVFEEVLQAVDINELVRSSAGHDHHIYSVDAPSYWITVDPKWLAFEVENIVPGAKQRAQEVIGSRRSETVSQIHSELEGQPGEWNELIGAIKAAEEQGTQANSSLVKRVVDLCAFRARLGEEATGLSIRTRLGTLFDLQAQGHIDFEALFGAFADINDTYEKLSEEAAHETSLDDFNGDPVAEFYASMKLDLIRGNSLTYILELAPALATQSKKDSTLASSRLSELFDKRQLETIVDRYIAFEIEPQRKDITPERQRLVMTYENKEFKPPKSEGELGPMKVKHPEKGPRNMIWEYPLQTTAKSIVLDSLREALASDSIAELIGWYERFDNREIVKYIPSFSLY